jgi:hypothetical protein
MLYMESRTQSISHPSHICPTVDRQYHNKRKRYAPAFSGHMRFPPSLCRPIRPWPTSHEPGGTLIVGAAAAP